MRAVDEPTRPRRASRRIVQRIAGKRRKERWRELAQTKGRGDKVGH
jgi:hypothetical protein